MKPPIITLFANTGIQYVNTAIKGGPEFETWRRLRDTQQRIVWWVLAQAIEGEVVLAVDTRTGPASHLFLAPDTDSIPHPTVELRVSETESVIVDILTEGVGGPTVDVAFVLDFGNCRSMGMFLELVPIRGQVPRLPAQEFLLYDHRKQGLDQYPMELLDRPEHPEMAQNVFDSRFDFVNDRLPKVEYEKHVTPEAGVPKESKGVLRFLTRIFHRIGEQCGLRKDKSQQETVPPPTKQRIVTRLFADWSPLRMGAEADAFRTLIPPELGLRTGMSSPKRYLWASDPGLDGYWQQILLRPNHAGTYFEAVNGDIFRFMYHDDQDWTEPDFPVYSTNPPPHKPGKPCYPPRATMVFCLYELLVQAVTQVNSLSYREKTMSPLQKRRLSHLVMSFPSAMCSEEVERFRTQARKAISMVSFALSPWDKGKASKAINSQPSPELVLRTDEGSAGQLAYVYGEIQRFGLGRNWLEHVARREPIDGLHRARIASLDVGGGTTDLLIADYTDRGPRPFTNLRCEIQHLDGSNKAGDEIIKCLIEQIFIPKMALDLNMNRDDVRLIFEDVSDAAFNARKRSWISEIWVPVARAYLARAEKEDGGSFTFSNACPTTKALDQMHKAMSARGVVTPPVGTVSLKFDRGHFERVVKRALERTLRTFSKTIVSFDCDLLLLAGRSTRLPALRAVLSQHLPMPRSRIISLDRFYTGAWYPLARPEMPGRIADPKSVVTVGSAIEFLSSQNVAIGNFQTSVQKSKGWRHRSYFWGTTTENVPWFENRDALFKPFQPNESRASLQVLGPRCFIARRLSNDENEQVAPVYCIEVLKRHQHDRVEVVATVQRHPAEEADETLELVGVEGRVGDDPAELGRNVKMSLRTMFEDRYFLDTEAFLGIDYANIPE